MIYLHLVRNDNEFRDSVTNHASSKQVHTAAEYDGFIQEKGPITICKLVEPKYSLAQSNPCVLTTTFYETFHLYVASIVNCFL